MEEKISCRVLEIPALGYAFSLGTLYNAWDETIVPGVTLWDPKDLKDNVKVVPIPCIKSNLTHGNQLEEKTKFSNMEGSLSVSLLSGIIKGKGSGSKKLDFKNSQKEAIIRIDHHQRTKSKELTMAHLSADKIRHHQLINGGVSATHVVTSIEYGANASFIFRKSVTEFQDKETVEGELKLMSNKLIKFIANTSADVDISNRNGIRNDKNDIQCQFEGDYAIDKNPTSYEEAVDFCRRLPTIMVKDQDGSPLGVPYRVFLYPLVLLNAQAPILKRQISNGVAKDCFQLFLDYDEIVAECQSQLDGPLTSQVEAFREKLRNFQSKCQNFRSNLEPQITHFVTRFRSGITTDDREIRDFLNSVRDSVFDPRRLKKWLDSKHHEMQIIQNFIKRLGPIKFLSSERELINRTTDHSIERAFVLVLTSVADPESQLQDMDTYLTEQGSPSSENRKGWYQSHDMIQRLEMTIDQFLAHYHFNEEDEAILHAFTILSAPDSSLNNGMSICIYQRGNIVFKNFNIQPDSTDSIPQPMANPHPQIPMGCSSYHYNHNDSQLRGFIWQPNEKECTAGEMSVRYGTALDSYKRDHDLQSPPECLADGVSHSVGIDRILDMDWGLSFISLNGKSDEGSVSWTVALPSANKSLKTVLITNPSNGDVTWSLCTQSNCYKLPKDCDGLELDIDGSHWCTLTAHLRKSSEQPTIAVQGICDLDAHPLALQIKF